MVTDFWAKLVAEKKVFQFASDTGGGGAAENHKLANPNASGVLLIVKRITVSASFTGSLQAMELRDTAVTTLANGPFDGLNMYQGEAVSVGKCSHVSGAAIAGSARKRMRIGAIDNKCELLLPDEPHIIVPPNSALTVVSSSGDIISVSWTWGEYTLPA